MPFNDGVLPDEYNALAEQQAAGLGPGVLTLQGQLPDRLSAEGSTQSSFLCRRNIYRPEDSLVFGNVRDVTSQ